MISDAHINDTATHSGKGKFKRVVFEILQFVAIVIFIVFPIRLFVAQPFVVNGSSMDPTFGTGQYLIVDQITYRLADPTRGEVIIFRYPKNPSKFFIKRVIGLPGETVTIDGGNVHISSPDNEKGFILDEPYIEFEKSETFSTTLEDNEYFVMGDNRSGSSDSRSWGPLEEQFIIGRAFVRLLPVTTLDLFPGYHTFTNN